MARTVTDKILAAAGHGDLEGVRNLLDSGVSVNIANYRVEELLAKGADPDAIDANGRNAEQLARERGHAVAADLVAASRNK